MFVSKDKIYKNRFINKIICKSLLPLTLISSILTQSPINLIFGIILLAFSLFIFSRNIFKLLFKTILVGLPIILIIIICLSRLDLSESFLNRIIVTLEVIKNFDALIIVEASLATRIISYVNMFIIYMHHPIFGTGCGSLTTEIYNQLSNSPLPLTWELNQMILSPKASNANPAIIFKLLVDTGSIGFICFGLFLYNIYIKINNKLINFNPNITSFLLGIKYTMLAFIFLSIYNSDIACHFYWAIFGVVSGLALKRTFIINKQGEKVQNEQNLD